MTEEEVTIHELKGEPYEKFVKNQAAFSHGFIKYMPFNQVLPTCFIKDRLRLKNFKAKDGDVWVASFPKCGTTWSQEMVWCIMNDLDFPRSKERTLEDRVKFLEYGSLTEKYTDTIRQVACERAPRIIKTHLSWQMLPDQAKTDKSSKIIYVMRNPRDVCVSYYNHWKILEGYTGEFEDFADAFINDVTGYYTPFFVHLLGYWNIRNMENVCCFTYEEMKRDLKSVILKVANFLKREVAEEQMEAFLDHLSFDQMKKNSSTNKEDTVLEAQSGPQMSRIRDKIQGEFMRKGQVGDWQNHFSPELIRKFERWEQFWLKGSDLKFEYE